MVELEIKPSAAAQVRVFIVIALACGVLAVFIFLLTGGGRNLFDAATTISTYMPDVTGLYLKGEVRLSGIPVGYISKIELSGLLDPQRVVRVDMRVNDKFLKSIPRDSETSISADTLVGWEFVSIKEGQSPIPVPENGTLRSEPLKAASDNADLVGTARDELKQVDDILVQISSGQTKIGQFVLGEAEYDNILKRITGFDQSIHALVSPKSPLGQALFSRTLYDKVNGSVQSLDKSLASIQKGEGAGGKMFASDEQYVELVKTLQSLHASLAAVNAGKTGMLHDDTTYRNLQKLLAQTDTLLASLDTGNGMMAKLMRDPQLYQQLTTSLQKWEAFARDLRLNPKKYLRYKPF